jgi:hypothetical protein
MQRSSAIPIVGVKSLDWTKHRRCGFIPAQANGLGFVSVKDTRAEGPIHPRRVNNMVRAFSPPNSAFPSTQAVGLGWYRPHLRC